MVEKTPILMDENVKVLIGIPTSEFGRRADFYDYLNRLEKPHCWIMAPHGSSPARSRNIIIENALQQNCSHVFFLDDDMAFQPNLLQKLLSHDKDIVSGLYVHRNFPHQAMVFEKLDKKGRAFASFLGPDTPELIKIQAAGFGCCLIKTSILRKMEKPWVRLGELDSDQWCDDIGFFSRLRGITDDIWCDTTARVGHIGTMIVWPYKDEAGWFTCYDTTNPMDGTGNVKIPQAALTEEISNAIKELQNKELLGVDGGKA